MPVDEIGAMIEEAMRRRKTLRLEYRGADETGFHEREIEPWCYGLQKDTGNPVLRAFQVAGHSESSAGQAHPFWRLMRLDRMRNVQLTDRAIRSSPPADYNPDDPAMDPIFRRLPK